MARKIEVVRELNDRLRLSGSGGLIAVTQGVAALGLSKTRRILAAVAAFDRFSDENDPYGEHDFGKLSVDDEIIWKIDYYDLGLRHHSPDPADPRVTTRVLTIMRAEEY